MTHIVLSMLIAALFWVMLQSVRGGSRCDYCGKDWGRHEDACPYQL